MLGLDGAAGEIDMTRLNVDGGVGDGRLGRQTGQGVYTWTDGEAVKAIDAPVPDPDRADRLAPPLLNTCMSLRR